MIRIRRSYLRKWTVVVGFMTLLTILTTFCLLPEYNLSEPKSYHYSGGWQKSDVCDNTAKMFPKHFTTMRYSNIELNLYIHNPKKDAVSKKLYEASALEDLPRLKLVKSFLEVFTDIDYVIDIGAHVGSVTVLSALMSKKVISIDGDVDSLKLACSTVSLLGLHKNVVFIDEVIGVSHKAVTWIHLTDGNYSGSFVDSADDAWMQQNEKSKFKIQGRAPIMIDNLIAIFPNLRSNNIFMHIDVNGYENMVLLGAQLLMKKANVRGVLINFTVHKNQSSGKDIVAMMKKINLHPYMYDHNTLINLEKVRIDEWPDILIWI